MYSSPEFSGMQPQTHFQFTGASDGASAAFRGLPRSFFDDPLGLYSLDASSVSSIDERLDGSARGVLRVVELELERLMMAASIIRREDSLAHGDRLIRSL